MSDRKVTHFADGFPLAYINRLERELAEEYFQAAVERIQRETQQTTLF